MYTTIVIVQYSQYDTKCYSAMLVPLSNCSSLITVHQLGTTLHRRCFTIDKINKQHLGVVNAQLALLTRGQNQELLLPGSSNFIDDTL